MTEQINFATLNCWAIPYLSKRKDERVAYLASELCKGQYDIICLEEIWSQRDFNYLKEKLMNIYGFSNYFHGHTFGSGLCIFSKWPIQSALSHSFATSGYPHNIHHGDWYCGKGYGLAKIISPKGYHINVYILHALARYEINRKDDIYEGHRTAQIIELIEFIRASMASADVIFVAGDFNLEPETISIQLFQTFLDLHDSWLECAKRENPNTPLEQIERDGCTCEREGNPYAHKDWTLSTGNGIRVDYIMYRSVNKSTVSITCESCNLTFREVPDVPSLHYSDHEGLGARFTISESNHLPVTRFQRPQELPHESGDPASPSSLATPTQLRELLLRARSEVEAGIERCQRDHYLHKWLLAVLCCLLACLVHLVATGQPIGDSFAWLRGGVVLVAGVVGAVAWCVFWGVLVLRRVEVKALTNALQSLAVNLESLQRRSLASRAGGAS